MKRAVFPGSFDPITLGHLDILTRSLSLFDEVVIAVGINADKKTMFSLDQRMDFIAQIFKDNPKVAIKSYTGLTVEFCKTINASHIIRGLRNTSDFNYEQSIAQTNHKLAGIDSIFLMCSPTVSNISSSIVRDVMRNNGDFSTLVPSSVTKN